jgi:hypothetical protein
MTRAVKTCPVRTISREVFVTPQRLHAKHPFGMMIQSDLSGNRKLNSQRLAFEKAPIMHSRAIEERKRSLILTDEQREVLVGILLGDACLESRNRGRTYRLKVEQSAHHLPYVQHLYQVFEPWVFSTSYPKERTTRDRASTISWSFSTVSHSALRFYAHQFYDERRKRVPELIHRWLTPRGLAYWYMDDGSMKSAQSKGALFNTQGFSKGEVERLIEVLKSQFDLLASPRQQSDGWQIYISGTSFEVLGDLIEPFVISAMRYKIPAARQPRRTPCIPKNEPPAIGPRRSVGPSRP